MCTKPSASSACQAVEDTKIKGAATSFSSLVTGGYWRSTAIVSAAGGSATNSEASTSDLPTLTELSYTRTCMDQKA